MKALSISQYPINREQSILRVFGGAAFVITTIALTILFKNPYIIAASFGGATLSSLGGYSLYDYIKNKKEELKK